MPREPSSSPLTIRYWEIHPAWEYQFFFSRQSYGPSQPSYQMHDHDFFEFFLVESGNVVHRINGETEILRPGDLRLILPRDTHQLVPEKGKEFEPTNAEDVPFVKPIDKEVTKEGVEAAKAAMNELQESFQLKPAVEKKIEEYLEKD